MKFKRGNKFKTPLKLKQKGIQVTGQWKPVEIDPNLFADEQLGGLVCFEELTDYKLVASRKVGEETKTRKAVGEEEDSETVKSESPVPKKKRKKEKNLGQEATEDSGLTTEDQPTDWGDTVASQAESDEGVETSLKQKPKKRKRKKKACSLQDVPTTTSKKAKSWTAEALSASPDVHVDMSAWKGLFVPQPVLRALGELGFSAPTPIQAMALPSAIRDSMDVLGAAETGSGKTLAFAIPMIHSILQWQASEDLASEGDSTLEEAAGREDDVPILEVKEEAEGLNPVGSKANGTAAEDDKSPATGCMKVSEDIESDLGAKKHDVEKRNPLLGLVLTPTRELAVQVKHHIDAVAKYTGIKSALVVGGMASQKQQRILKRKPEIIVATPGRLWELIQERHPHLSSFRRLRCLVIDEADRMVEKGHFLELSQLLEMLNESHYNPKRQIFVFSATLTLIHQTPTRILRKKKAVKIDRKTKLDMLMQKVGIKNKPKVIDLTRKEATVETLTETRIHCNVEEKDYYLYYFLLQYPGRTMVFANSIDCIKRLTALLTILDCNPLPLHANMHQKQRLKNLERFAERDW
uniref:Uncharacterized protein n=1 Tax=Sphaerodactylus townsendi TaxID=933632 RepID=A0ACB8G612_9SAUR